MKYLIPLKLDMKVKSVAGGSRGTNPNTHILPF